MSPESARAVIRRVACPRCGSEAGDRCQRSTGRRITFPHQERVLADLFTPHERKP